MIILENILAIRERISRNGGVERMAGRFVVTPFHFITNMRVLNRDNLREHPVRRVAHHEYARFPWATVCLLDICEIMDDLVRQQDPNFNAEDLVAAAGGGTNQ